jgi:hypothetical protein
MKSLFRSAASLCLTIVVFMPAPAQITISGADVNARLALGSILSSKTDTSTKTANIGTPGATSWDFSTLKTNFTGAVTIVRPDTTPFFGLFPGSTQAERSGFPGGVSYAYLELGTDLLLAGSGLSGFFMSRTINTPAEIVYQLPMMMGTSWTSTYVESTYVTLPPPSPPQITVTNQTINNAVDAYGSLTLPGGGVFQALRLKTDRRATTSRGTTRSITYELLTREGAFVNVLAADTSQPNSGTINVSSISWSLPLSSAVRLSDPIPGEFALMQNYPNPFNPSTEIRYELAGVSDAKLSVYDLLGREVAVLVNEREAPGSYSVKFDALGLASGVYFYRLHVRQVDGGQAGSFMETKKSLLIR